MRKYPAGIACLAILACTTTYAANEPVNNHVKLFKQVHHARSLPLRFLAALPQKKSKPYSLPMRHINIKNNLTTAFKPDAAQQLAPTAALGVTITHDYLGVGVGLGGFTPVAGPPDTTGSVGMTQYVQMINVSIAAFSKADNSLVMGPANINTLWAGFGGVCETKNNGDPVVKYDQIANRWVISQFAFVDQDEPPFYQCVAVSTTPDVGSAYNLYAFEYNDYFNDYGKLGLWRDAYYMTYFTFSPSSYIGPRVCALDRDNMLAGNDARAQQCFDLSNNPSYYSFLPADLDGSMLPPANAPELLLSINTNANQIDLWRFFVNWNDSSKSKLIGPVKVRNINNFTTSCASDVDNCVPQPGTAQHLDALSDRLMYRLAYRQFPKYGALIANHTVQSSNATASVRWYQINIVNDGLFVPRIFQQGTFSPDSTNRWMGSAAIDKNGNIALGYSISSDTVFPSIAITGRQKSDLKGTMRDESVVSTGTGVQTGLNRWGDYTTMSIDPVDDCTFWYTNEYLTSTAASKAWSTRVVAFKFPDCS